MEKNFALQSYILVRALGEKGFKDIYEQYKNARKNAHGEPPSEKAVRLAGLVKKHGYKKASQMVGVDVVTAYSAVSSVSRYNFLKQ